MPCLFIEARQDGVLSTALGGLSEPMRRFCRDLTECSVNAAHWLQLEKPEAVNAALARVMIFSLSSFFLVILHTPLLKFLC